MRRFIYSMIVSLDGYIEDARKQIDWHLVDDEFNAHALETLHAIDGIVFGRVSYQQFASYWPAAAIDPATTKDNRKIARRFDDLHKVVLSTTMTKTTWTKSILIRENLAAQLGAIKRQPGRDFTICGAAAAATLMRLGMVDEIRVLLVPIVLGGGTPMFPPSEQRQPLRLTSTRTFASGLVELRYVTS